MVDQNFYVEYSKLLSNGLSSVGMQDEPLGFSYYDNIERLSGNLIGQGIYNINREEKKTDIILSALESNNPFVRRCAIFSLGLSYLGEGVKDVSLFKEMMKDEDIEVKKASLISLGLSHIRKGNDVVKHILSRELNDENWKVRSAAGLGYSFAFLDDDRYFEDIKKVLESECNPYVKVCSSWYISLANAGFPKYSELLKTEDSFFRDMASLGLGYGCLGEGNEYVTDALEGLITNDAHPYVRESACFGLGLNYFQNPNKKFEKIISNAFKDDSSIVRSGAALAKGIANYKKRFDLKNLIDGEKDRSVLWGLYLSQGLSDPKHIVNYKGPDNYIRWASELKDSFRETQTNKTCAFEDITNFQTGINLGMINANLKDENAASFKLIYPGVSYYILYDSFWWGLWVLSSLGAKLWNDGNKFHQ